MRKRPLPRLALWLVTLALLACQQPVAGEDSATDTVMPDPDLRGLSIDAVSPRLASSSGGNSVTVRGAGFEAGMTVTFDGAPAATVALRSSHELSVQVPPNLGRQGLVSIELRTNSGSTVKRADLFSYYSETMIFRPAHSTGARPVAIASADFDGDGRLDLVTANESDGTASVLLGKGQGRFAEAITLPMGGQPRGLATGDLDGNGLPDLVTANFADNTIGIRLAQTGGGFSALQSISVGQGPCRLVTSDVNLDGALDLLVADCSRAAFAVLLGRGDGTFAIASTVNTSGTAGGMDVADA